MAGNNFQASTPLFYRVGPGNEPRFGSNGLYPSSHLACPQNLLLFEMGTQDVAQADFQPASAKISGERYYTLRSDLISVCLLSHRREAGIQGRPCALAPGRDGSWTGEDRFGVSFGGRIDRSWQRLVRGWRGAGDSKAASQFSGPKHWAGDGAIS